MSLETNIQTNNEREPTKAELEDAANKFFSLVDKREKKDAREFYEKLPEYARRYIEKQDQGWKIKAAYFSA
ncbi:hypothetical protein GOV14_05645 [Candidatus Pacearchaeota archaeon]|nr:hypothetical protein [Candidatus Pacearchaeota archaeon]